MNLVLVSNTRIFCFVLFCFFSRQNLHLFDTSFSFARSFILCATPVPRPVPPLQRWNSYSLHTFHSLTMTGPPLLGWLTHRYRCRRGRARPRALEHPAPPVPQRRRLRSSATPRQAPPRSPTGRSPAAARRERGLVETIRRSSAHVDKKRN